MISQEKFNQLKQQGYNYIPVSREIFADLDTPLSIYWKLANQQPFSYLFESVQGGEKWGRYSIIGLPCSLVIQIKNKQITLIEQGEVIETHQVTHPLNWIDQYQKRFNVPKLEGLPRFVGGLVGYFGYDTIAYIEPKLSQNDRPDPLDTPDILLLKSDELVVFDNLRSKLQIIVHTDPAQEHAWEIAQKRLNELVQKIRSTHISFETHQQPSVSENDFISEFQQEDYESAVNRIKDYIHEGDVMQVVLSQRLSIPYTDTPINLYRALRCLNPSPYMYFMNLGDFYIVGSSPEILVRLEEGTVTVRPIAGTRPRGKDESQDLALEKELLADPKERAEHLMLIDLGRNDVGRIAQVGSVKLTERYDIERYSHVMHIISNVVGQLKTDLSCMDVLKATFPAGTVSGAPKIRAMEVINELEPVKRGIYSGAIGYISWSGNMDTAIAIRTAVIKNNRLYIQVGAGIVADSIPRNEWEETMNKGRAIFKAVEIVATGLE